MFKLVSGLPHDASSLDGGALRCDRQLWPETLWSTGRGQTHYHVRPPPCGPPKVYKCDANLQVDYAKLRRPAP